MSLMVRIHHNNTVIHEEVCDEDRAGELIDALPEGDESISIELPGDWFLDRDLFVTERG